MAADVNVMPFTSVFAEMEILVVFERAKVAVSVGPLGTQVVSSWQRYSSRPRWDQDPTEH